MQADHRAEEYCRPVSQGSSGRGGQGSHYHAWSPTEHKGGRPQEDRPGLKSKDPCCLQLWTSFSEKVTPAFALLNNHLVYLKHKQSTVLCSPQQRLPSTLTALDTSCRTAQAPLPAHAVLRAQEAHRALLSAPCLGHSCPRQAWATPSLHLGSAQMSAPQRGPPCLLGPSAWIPSPALVFFTSCICTNSSACHLLPIRLKAPGGEVLLGPVSYSHCLE